MQQNVALYATFPKIHLKNLQFPSPFSEHVCCSLLAVHFPLSACYMSSYRLRFIARFAFFMSPYAHTRLDFTRTPQKLLHPSKTSHSMQNTIKLNRYRNSKFSSKKEEYYERYQNYPRTSICNCK